MPEKEPLVSIIIINFKDKEKLKLSIESILNSKYKNYEIIVVDVFTPEIEKWITETFSSNKIRVIHFGKDIGAAHSHNVGAEKANKNSKYLVFMDNDVIVDENWLNILVNLMEKNPEIGIAQPKILLYQNIRKMDHCGLALDYLGTWYTTYGEIASKFNNTREVFAATSATLITRKDLYFKVGGFDPDYFIYDDDTDYSWRVRLMGYKVVMEPKAITIHMGGLNKGLSYMRLYHGYKNRISNLIKNLEGKNMVLQVPITLMYGFVLIIGLFAFLRFTEAKAYLMATLYVLRNFKKIVRKRVKIQYMRKISDNVLYSKNLLRKDIRATIMMFKTLTLEYLLQNPKYRRILLRIMKKGKN